MNTPLAQLASQKEEELRLSLAKLLHLPSVGAMDDLFSLGLSPEMEQEFIKSSGLTAYQIHIGRTPRFMAELWAEDEYEVAEREIYPLNQSQLGVYIESMNHQGEASYNVPYLLSLDEGISLPRLADAFVELLRTHDCLHTRLVVDEEGNVGQRLVVDADYRPSIEENDLPQDEWRSGLQRPFNLLGDERLFRCEIYQRAEGNYLFMDFHHSIFDGASMRILLQDLDKAYRGEALQPVLTKACEAAVIEEAWQGSARWKQAHDWHAARLEGLEIDSLPLADQQQEASGFALIKEDLRITRTQLEGFCKQQGISENVFFMASFAYFLARYQNDEAAFFATIHHGRRSKKFSRSIGMFVQTLPFFLRTEGLTKRDELFAGAQDSLTGARNHSSVSFAELVADFGVSAKMLFAYHGELYQQMPLGDYKVQAVSLDHDNLDAPFVLQVSRLGQAYRFALKFACSMYTEEMSRLIMDSWQMVMQGLMESENLADISLCSAEQQAALSGFTAPSADYDRSDTVLSLFRAQLAQRGDEPALVFKENTYSYKQLDALSDRVAQALLSAGMEAGEVVPVLISRSEFMGIAPLAIMKCRCCYQPLDSSYPSERLGFMVQDSCARFLITEKSLRPMLADYEGHCLYVEDVMGLPDVALDANLTAPTADDSFVLLYTSGSTGTPKGAPLSQGNIVSFIHWAQAHFSLNTQTRSAVYASFGFDAHMVDLYPTLASGGTVYIVPEEIRLDLVELEQYYAQQGITHALMTTQVGRQFAQSASVPSLRHLSVGGEALVALDPPTDFVLHNLYGPTECTIAVTAYPYTQSVKKVPIGCATAHTKLYVVDRLGQQQAIGGLGELWIAGRQVGEGYLNQPELTEKVFVENPFDSDADYARVYRTGDVVRCLPDGNMDFVGRRDAQVKIRGFRVELSEVEGILREFPDIEDATVQAFDKAAGGKYLAAYVVSQQPVDWSALRAFVLAKKPPYILPECLMQIDAIPLTQNQKVNKRALPAPELAGASHEEEQDTRPLNILEEELREIIAEILGTEQIAVSTLLAHAGLSSISAIKLAIVLYKRYGLRMDSRELLQLGSIAEIENRLLRQLLSRPDKGAQAEPAEEGHLLDSYPLSSGQLGVYYECLKHPETTSYNIPSMMRFSARISNEEMKNALQAFVDAHPALMTCVVTGGEEVEQALQPHDLLIEEEEVQQDAVEKTARAFVRPFKLEGESLFRMKLLRSPEALYLLTDFHHLIFDGASYNVFLSQLCALLRGESVEAETYSFFHAMDEELHEDMEQHRAYFDKLLRDTESSSVLPADLKDREEHGRLQECVEAAPSQRIDEACQRMGITAAQLFLAATCYTTARYTNQKQVQISTVSSGRSDPRRANSMGMYVKTVPIATSIAEQTVEGFFHDCAQLLEQSIEHESYPFAKLVADYQLSPDMNYAYQVGLVEEHEVAGEPVEKQFIHSSLSKAKFKISINIETRQETGEKYNFVLQYDDGLYSAELMAHFARSLRIVLEEMIAHPEAALKQVSLLDDERRAVLAPFHQRTKGPVQWKLFHEGLEQQAVQKAEHPALIACDRTLSFAQLNAEANRLAHALMERGVRPHDRVALLLPRDSRFIVSVFAVLKAAAAFIPCDPDYPTDRIAHIIADSESPFVLTTAERAGDFPGLSVDIADIDLSQYSDENPSIEQSEDSLAYLIYTSGSTGKPKGVMLRHEGVCNFLSRHEGNFVYDLLINEVTRLMSVTTVSFDMSIMELYGSLMHGVTLVFADEEQSRNLLSLIELFNKTGADYFNTTPSRLLQYIEMPEFCEILARCKIVAAGGEGYPEKLLLQLREITKAYLLNGYGPTEITVASNMKDLTHASCITTGPPSYNVTNYVVDGDGNELPAGMVGELYIGGLGVAAGYNNLPELTARSFINYHGERVYKSGDYASWNDEGDIIIYGRTDNQVKLRGLRIELGEIESNIALLPHIKRVAIKIQSIHGKEHLCAYFTADMPMDISSMKQELQKTLTAYMIPSAWMQLEEMPMTANGKTDVKRLPIPTPSEESHEMEEADGEVEQFFCDCFARILNMDKVGATDNFFDLGGTSLVVTRIIIDASKAGYHLAYGDVFTNATPRLLAALINHSESRPSVICEKIQNYDYKAIDDLLQQNTLDAFREGEEQELGNVLITGSTGFLGIHLLKELIDNHDGHIYCLLRDKHNITGERRLKSLLYYYFEDTFEDLFGTRIFTAVGDIASLDQWEHINKDHIDTVINCAANVKHFSKDHDIEDVNLGGVGKAITFCLEEDARLIHISTMSVTGFSVNQKPRPGTAMHENELFLGQFIDNQYVGSKFLAERLILAAVAEKGLNAKVMRVGNLSARNSDGEFQVNFTTNSFMGRLRSFNLLGHCPYEMLDNKVEFSPVDEVARAIHLLSRTPRACTVFHPYNHHPILLADVFDEMNELGLHVKPVERSLYLEKMDEAKLDPEKAKILSSIIAYEDMAHGQVAIPVIPNNSYTMQVLYRLGYHWPTTSKDYIGRFVKELMELDYFEQ